MKTGVFFLSLFMVATGAAQAAPRNCELQHAVYRDPEGLMDIRFKKMPQINGLTTDVVLDAHSNRSKKDYWFVFDQGSAPRINLISTTDINAPNWMPPVWEEWIRPLGEMDYYAIRDDLSIDVSRPHADSTPPKYVFIPELYSAFRNLAKPPEIINISFYDFVGCQ